MLIEKAAFLQKHDQVLFGKDFRDHLTESLKTKKESIERLAEVSKSTNRERDPFERALILSRKAKWKGGTGGRGKN